MLKMIVKDVICMFLLSWYRELVYITIYITIYLVVHFDQKDLG